MAEEQAEFSIPGMVMETLEAMKDGGATEWQVKKAALDLYPRILTEADIETVAGWYT